MLTLIILIIFLLTVVGLVGLHFYSILFRGFAPFISTRKRTIEKAIAAIDTDSLGLGSIKTVYELGCGRALFLRAWRKKYPETKLVGLDYHFFPYWLAKINNRQKRNRVIILRKNFLKINLQEADLIYCYLNINTMKILKEKFLKECRPGTIIISLMFSLPDIKPTRMIRDGKAMLYFYKL
ncbi:MAG: class I SAM-dependent methyltransferase [Patescibacteria group bacterium]|jgi:trans-aconitate methyltransferase